MTDLKELAAILYRILSKPVTLQVWVIALLGFVCMCGVGWLHSWIGAVMLGWIGLALVGVVMLSHESAD